jgi:hypothetical protein
MRKWIGAVVLCLSAIGCSSESHVTFRLVDADTQQPLGQHHVDCYRETSSAFVRADLGTDTDGKLTEIIMHSGDAFRMEPDGYKPIVARVQRDTLYYVSPATSAASELEVGETEVPLTERMTVTIGAKKKS